MNAQRLQISASLLSGTRRAPAWCMTDDEGHAPDSLRGKLDGLLGEDRDSVTDGTNELKTDTGGHVPTDADDPPPAAPKRPTDPPF